MAALVAHSVSLKQGMALYREGGVIGSRGIPPPTPPRVSSQLSSSRARPASHTSSPAASRLPPRHRNLGNQHHKSRAEEDNKIKLSRGWANAYELSQDLHDKQLEVLERKYGGQLRARKAARVIQQAYRQYCMNKNFEKLRSEVEEKRLSRRFAEFGRSKTIWTDMVSSVESSYFDQPGGALSHTRHYTTDAISTLATRFNCEDQLNHNVTGSGCQSSALTSSTSSHSIRSMRMSQKSHSVSREVTRRPLQRSMGLDLSTVTEQDNKGAKRKEAPTDTSPEEANNNTNCYPARRESSASDSSDTPVEPAVDLASVNFENMLETKETDILSDNFQSEDGSVEGVLPSRVSNILPRISQKTKEDGLLKDESMMCDKCQTPMMESLYAEPGTELSNDVQVNVEDLDIGQGDVTTHHSMPSPSDMDRSVSQHTSGANFTKMFGNTKVRLRKRQCGNVNCSASQVPADPKEEVQVSAKRTSPEASPIWKRKSSNLTTSSNSVMDMDAKRMSNISETSEADSLAESREGLSSSASSDTASMCSVSDLIVPTHNSYQRTLPSASHITSTTGSHPNLGTMNTGMSDRQRKRAYRIGLNLFNKKPEKGVRYLIEQKFVEDQPEAVAHILITRKGLSKQMIGEYLGNIQNQFNMEVLQCFSEEIDISGLQLDVALRKYQSYFRMPGEAQKIERLMEAFAERFIACNEDQIKSFRSLDTIFLLAFATIMLNTDLHNQSIKPERKMSLAHFIRNLRGIDDGEDIDVGLLTGIYNRIKVCEFKPGTDQVSQVRKVENMVVGKTPTLSLPHRRLVCYCRLYEVHDPNRREKLGLHQREVFLFNDLLVVTKILSKKKSNVTYSFRQSFALCGMQVYLFETSHYKHGVRLTTNINGKVLITFNARNEHDRSKFVEDLKESILEMNEMESLRIDEELQKQANVHAPRTVCYNRHSKDSGVVDMDLLKPNTDPAVHRLSAPECGSAGLKKSTLSNSLIDLAEGTGMRRGSGGSLDSGMVSTNSGSREDTSGSQRPPKTPVTARFSLFGGAGGGKKSKSKVQESSEV